MRLEATLNASYPRSEDVAKLYSKFLSNKISAEEFDRGIEDATLKLFRLLRSVNIKVFTDGMLRWDDIFNPLIRFIEGVEVNGLMRFYDNNFFFRAPTVKSKLRVRDDVPLINWFKKSVELAKNVFGNDFMLKQVLPGPLTLATNSINKFYSSVESLIHDWRSEVLEPLIKYLSSTGGLRVVEIHEPSLTWRETNESLRRLSINELRNLINYVKKVLGIDVWILTYFGSLRVVGDDISELADAVIGIDYFTKDLGRVQLVIRDHGLRRVMLGLIDSRNTRMEDPLRIRRSISRVLDYGAREVFVGNNAPMDFIPEVIASKKIKRLGKIISKIKGEIHGMD